ncbi:MAG: UDP-N-acetylglucosamine--N-acetylmuramyl-(pentapeptide) pyrophosphoryl-undecaprenol N-acetylglucosamine transferase, partial [Akkermansiaceae bacterium]|nr:UDP-N-acetylglucosamine--N-acetylmuramyl-(pentapeptide) pyrophosphoryl-undecaprenol N-acetylglucosamine transferase [Akkermansiaceae bacterium]
GAQRLNSLVVEAAATAGDAIQWLHVAGTADAARVEGLAAGRSGYKVYGFFSEMPTAYAASDLVICRSGASSLTELAFVGLPGILVPYPYAADDHQTANAKAFVDGGGALMAQEKDLDAAKLAGMVSGLLGDDARRGEMAQAMRALSHDHAAGEIADVIEGEMAG